MTFPQQLKNENAMVRSDAINACDFNHYSELMPSRFSKNYGKMRYPVHSSQNDGSKRPAIVLLNKESSESICDPTDEQQQ
jgi:hypothetical protein